MPFWKPEPTPVPVVIKDEKTIINNTDVEVLNESVNEFISNTYINSAAECGASSTGSQTIKFGDIYIAPGASTNFDFNQYMAVNLDFSCQQYQQARNEIANDLYIQMMNDILTSNNSEILGELELNAEQQIENGWTPRNKGSTTPTQYEPEVDYEVINDTHTAIQNIVKTSISNNFSSESLQSCTSRMLGTQAIEFGDVVNEGNFNANLDQTMATESIASCQQIQDTSNYVVNDVFEGIGVEVVTENDTSLETETAITINTKVINKGPFESLGEGISNAAKGIGEGLGSILKSLTGPIVICCCILCIACILCCFLIFGGAMMSGSKETTTYEQPTGYEAPSGYEQTTEYAQPTGYEVPSGYEQPTGYAPPTEYIPPYEPPAYYGGYSSYKGYSRYNGRY